MADAGEGTYISTCSTDNTIDDRSPRRNETRTRGNGDKASNDTGAESYSGPFLLKTIIENTPSDTTDTSSEVGDHGGHDGAEVGSESRTGVESEPANPEEDSANDDVCDVVRAVV